MYWWSCLQRMSLTLRISQHFVMFVLMGLTNCASTMAQTLVWQYDILQAWPLTKCLMLRMFQLNLELLHIKLKIWAKRYDFINTNSTSYKYSHNCNISSQCSNGFENVHYLPPCPPLTLISHHVANAIIHWELVLTVKVMLENIVALNIINTQSHPVLMKTHGICQTNKHLAIVFFFSLMPYMKVEVGALLTLIFFLSCAITWWRPFHMCV